LKINLEKKEKINIYT